ncbi:hypothetical protein AHF37_10029 [Paragonimus kellicotti]|nr:hypothetical protein AHF37_10029 [Paragonimus kellicotti]
MPFWPLDQAGKLCSHTVSVGLSDAFIWLIRWTASFIAVKEFLHEHLVNSQTEDDRRRGSPVSLQDFLTRSVLACQQDGVRSLYNQEQTQLLGMRLLSCIISDLDSFLTLETQYHLVDTILQAHADGITQSGSHASSPYPYPMLVSLDDDGSLEAFDLLKGEHLLTLCTQPPCESWYMTLFRTACSIDTHPILTRVALRLNQSYPSLADSPESIQTWLATCRSCLYDHTKGDEKTDLCSSLFISLLLHVLKCENSSTVTEHNKG